MNYLSSVQCPLTKYYNTYPVQCGLKSVKVCWWIQNVLNALLFWIFEYSSSSVIIYVLSQTVNWPSDLETILPSVMTLVQTPIFFVKSLVLLVLFHVCYHSGHWSIDRLKYSMGFMTYWPIVYDELCNKSTKLFKMHLPNLCIQQKYLRAFTISLSPRYLRDKRNQMKSPRNNVSIFDTQAIWLKII